MAIEMQEEYKLCIRHIPQDIYLALNEKMLRERRHMHDIVRELLKRALLPEEGSVFWQVTVPSELDSVVSAWASQRGATLEQQIIEDLYGVYEVEEK